MWILTRYIKDELFPMVQIGVAYSILCRKAEIRSFSDYSLILAGQILNKLLNYLVLALSANFKGSLVLCIDKKFHKVLIMILEKEEERSLKFLFYIPCFVNIKV